MMNLLLPLALALALQSGTNTKAAAPAGVDKMIAEAGAVAPFVQSALAREYLSAIACLPRIETARTVYFNEETRDAMTVAQAQALSPEKRAGYEEKAFPEEFYYYTRYGTPVAFVRPLEILGRAGIKSADGLKILDFGFGTIGQLRALASLGADASGVEVDALLKAIYSAPGDTGSVPRCAAAGKGAGGRVALVFGQFPADVATTRQVGGGYDVFVSKNTLKRGYIHPDRDVDPKKLVQLRVDDETYVRAMYDILKPGGFALI